jgi:CHAD domain-containing protein
MKKTDVVGLGITQYELFQENYQEAVTTGEKEAIHQLRVSLKRFYALKKFFLHEMSPLGQAQIKNYLEPLRLVYKTAGKVRDVQVITDVAINSSPMKAPEELLEQLHLLLNQRLGKLKAMSKTVELPSGKEFAHQFKKHIKHFYENYDGKLDHFMEEKHKVARFYISSTEPGELWHDARTLIKQNYLLMQLASTIEPNQFTAESMLYYRNLEQTLGAWHDWVVLKKYALRYEVTRAYNMDSFLKQISQEMAVAEKTILKMAKF